MANPTFGSYTLPGQIQGITDDVAAELSTWKPSGRSGMGSEESLLAAKRVVITVRANYTSVALRDAGWEAIKAGLAVGPLRALVAYDTLTPARYFEARVEQVTRSLIPQFPYLLPYEATFLVPSGVALATTATAVTLTSTGGTVTAPAGTESALPILELAMSTMGAVIITNTTTNQSISLTTTATGTTYLDSSAETITRSGSDVSAEWTAGEFLRLEPGVSNTLTVAASGGAVVSGFALTYKARWR